MSQLSQHRRHAIDDFRNSGDGRNLSVLSLQCQLHLRHQTFDGLLELAVLGGVDERVDTAVGEHQYHGEVVEPAEPKEKVFPE